MPHRVQAVRACARTTGLIQAKGSGFCCPERAWKTLPQAGQSNGRFCMDYLGKEIPKLGFGLMRLPMLGEEVDVEQTKQMVDKFL